MSRPDPHHLKSVTSGHAAATMAAPVLPEPELSGVEQDAAIERLIRRSTRREGLDWDLLSRLDAEAWGTPADEE